MLDHEQIVFIALGLESDTNIFVKTYTAIICFFFSMQPTNDLSRISKEKRIDTTMAVPVLHRDLNITD